MRNSAIKSLFPSFLYTSSLSTPQKTKKFINEIAAEALTLQEVDVAGQRWCKKNYPNGYTSYGSYDRLQDFSSTFSEFAKAINVHVYRFAKILELDIDPKALRMSTCWVNVMGKNSHHSMHIHPLSVISGTFYVDLPKEAPGIKFEDPRQPLFMASPPRKENAKVENQRFYLHKPRAGDVVLFESWMRHEVPRVESVKRRISVSFNYEWS